jgi:catechol 2,3-dioxygenase-like lactoylglutathione lyase family enzyme
MNYKVSLTVENVDRSIAFYASKLGLSVEPNASPAFALLRIGDGTIGLLAVKEARNGASNWSPDQKRAIHVQFSSDNLDGLYEELKSRGVAFHEPPHDGPWKRRMKALDPDGYSVEFAQGRRGHNAIQTSVWAGFQVRGYSVKTSLRSPELFMIHP